MLLDRLALRPILEADEPGIGIDHFVARPIDELDRFRLELIDHERRGRDDFLDTEFLGSDRSDTDTTGKSERCRQQRSCLGKQHDEVFQ